MFTLEYVTKFLSLSPSHLLIRQLLSCVAGTRSASKNKATVGRK
uniref:Uncharacterized protein n=1 Tax=Anguilla anguilla TaxID=7936 RepID=A0A0E9V2X0_ANGAN